MKSIDSEKLVERKLVHEMKMKGGMCIKLLCNHLLGLPDRLCLFPGGKLAFVELKTTGQKPKKIQIFMHEKLRKLGYNVEVIDTVEGIYKFIEQYGHIQST